VVRETPNSVSAVASSMCKYCAYSFTDGWTALLEYDDVYQNTMQAASDSTHGFHESWDELRDELEV
jgi:hypothetical protein